MLISNNISTEEIKLTIKTLKKHKSLSEDMILSEMPKASVDIITEPLCGIFNAILNTGFYYTPM